MRWSHDLVRFPNGLRLGYAPMPETAGVSLGAWVGVGARHEPARLNGVCHFIEHLLFKGTRRRTARAIAEAVEGGGGSSDAYTQEDLTCYYARVPAERQEEMLEILIEMLTQPRLAPDDLERERRVIAEEIVMYRDQPAHRAEDLLLESLWPNHPLGRTITGTEASLARMTRPATRDFWHAKYQPANLVIALAGAVDRERTERVIRRRLGSRPSGVAARARPAPLRWPQRHFVCEGRETDQCHLSLGFRTFGRRDPRRYALRLFSVLAGETASSRLFQAVREDRGWAYSVSSQVHLFDETGCFGVEAGLETSRAAAALRLIGRELRRLATRGPEEAELRRARDYAIGQLRLGLESASSRLGWVGEQTLCYDRVLEPERVVAALQRVSLDEVRSVAAHVLRAARASVALVVPHEHQKEFAGAASMLASVG